MGCGTDGYSAQDAGCLNQDGARYIASSTRQDLTTKGNTTQDVASSTTLNASELALPSARAIENPDMAFATIPICWTSPLYVSSVL